MDDEYTERHHIIPKSMKGSNEKDNLVRVTPREHYIAHLMLWKSFRNRQTTYAFNCMNTATKTKKGKVVRYSNGRVYEKFLIAAREKMTGKNSPMFGKVKSEASRISQGNKVRGRKQSATHIENRMRSLKSNPNFGKWNLGRRASEESKLKMSKAHKGKLKTEIHKEKMKFRPQNNLSTLCPHCCSVGEFKNMKRWHFDFCKKNLLKIERVKKLVTCSECGVSIGQSPNFYKYHNKHCKANLIPKLAKKFAE